ncbi:MAG: putative tail tubular protein [Prokaryotic dsDNA virus sp.]|nr:MAG: putative tail tubular protein [Prokaryotic dsDNA virus sp.]|tara:strand:+ start:3979 stop:6819 length:2841 start_codon:yes stop_codon:yes gene_type:complete
MPLLTTSVPNLVQGVSQQPDNLRHPGQAESQVNAISSVVDGLTKRPNTAHVAEMGTIASTTGKTHLFNRDTFNKHAFIFTHNTSVANVEAKNLATGADIPVTMSTGAQTYLNTALSPEAQLKILTVSDYTFVVNTLKTVAEGTTISTPLQKEALVFVKQGAFNTKYNVNVNNSTALHTSGGTAPDADSEVIAEALKTALGTAFPSSGNYLTGITVTSGGSNYNVSAWTGYGILNLNASTLTDYKVVVEVSQSNGGNGAKGEAVISGGAIQSISMTHGGSGYDSDTATYPLTFTIKEYGFVNGNWYDLSDFFGSSIYLATGSFPTPNTSATFSVSGGQITAGATITAERQGNLLKITNAQGTDFSISASDGLSDTGLGVVYKEVDFITDLPKKCFNGFRVKVRGDAELVQDDYYVEFQTKDSESFGEGSWVETNGWTSDAIPTGQSTGIALDFNNTTMPITIVPNFTGDSITSYTGELTGETAATTAWAVRKAGDKITNPAPSFVGKQIKDIFFYKNRLGLLTESSVVFSEADEYFNFWRTTTQSLLDSAPIDVGISHTKVSLLQHAVPFQEKLMLFSANTQFVLRGSDLLTPKTVNISPVTEYEIEDLSNPFALSNFLYFGYKRGTTAGGHYSGLYEYYVDKDSETYDAVDLTAQVPSYIPRISPDIIGSASENTIIARSAVNSKQLFIYRFFWQGKDKIQSAWQRFDFANDILGMCSIESTVYLITHDGSKRCLETLELATGQAETGKTYPILLDRKVNSSTLSKSYSAITKLTTVTSVPYDPVNAVVYTIDGARFSITRVSSSSFTVNGDLSSTTFFVGLEYDMEYEFSVQTLKQPTEKGGRSSSNFTKQMLKNGSVEYADTGHFTIEVTPQYRDTYSYAFNPSSLGADSVVGSLILDSGSFRFPVHANHDDVTIKLKSSSALPAHLLSAEFESFIHARSRRYS